DFVVLYAGYDHERKGLPYLIEAIDRVEDQRIKLIAAGASPTGHYAKLIRQYGLDERVILPGYVDEIEKLMQAADVFCLPSLSEGFPLAALEAGAASLPIVATRVEGLEELICDGENGLFVKRDPEDIAEKLDILAADREIRLKMGSQMRQLVAKRYSWESVAQKHLELYQQLVHE
ncbi:MAG: glycosyltransferase family 4 protein, partial [Planctomycetes bacterium]|nr:glycosyltransferase family 4 protein [Planctomycetota bacterium]